ncbi:MAG: alpha/beta hydrolase [Tepidisphaeraceae bacterium]
MLRPIVIAYVVVCLVLYLLQEKLMFPAHDTQGRPDAVVMPREDREIINLKLPDGTPFVGMLSKTTKADWTAAPTVLFFYGNGNYLKQCADLAKTWRSMGVNVFIVEYPGYGMSGGKPGEKPFYAAADAAWEFLTTKAGIDAKKIIAGGWSLGGGSAIDLASRKPVAGLFTLSTFSSMPAIAGHKYWFLPTRLLVTHKFDNASKIGKVTCPTLIMHGRDDHFIPWTMSKRLSELAGGPVTTVFFDGYDHNDGWEASKLIDPALQALFDRVREMPNAK